MFSHLGYVEHDVYPQELNDFWFGDAEMNTFF